MTGAVRLSQLSLLIQETLQGAFAWKRFWVIAEVTNHSFYHQKGFHYFDLVEREERATHRPGGWSKQASPNILTKMAAVAWTSGAARIKAFEASTGQAFTNDIQVLVEVSVDYHPVYGLKLTLLDIDPSFTLGQQEQERQRTINRLLQDYPDYAWLQPDGSIQTFNQELELPVVIQRIAIVSSRTAAGYEDFLHNLEHNPFHYTFITDGFFTAVQGEQNAPALAATLEDVAAAARRTGLDYDAVVIIRGGGAATDLLLFDQLEIAAAVASCPFPVLTGIGHQRNESITDLMAHTSLKTPTKVAEFIIHHNRSFEQELLTVQQSVIIHAQQMLAASQQELLQLRSALVHQSQALLFQHKHTIQLYRNLVQRQPALLLSANHNRLLQGQQALQLLQKNFISKQRLSLDNLLRLTRMASPEKQLQRGFALLRKEGKFLSDARTLEPGDTIDIIMSDAEFNSTINSKKSTDGKPFDL